MLYALSYDGNGYVFLISMDKKCVHATNLSDNNVCWTGFPGNRIRPNAYLILVNNMHIICLNVIQGQEHGGLFLGLFFPLDFLGHEKMHYLMDV